MLDVKNSTTTDTATAVFNSVTKVGDSLEHKDMRNDNNLNVKSLTQIQSVN